MALSNHLYKFLSEENAPKWQTLLQPALGKVWQIVYILIFTWLLCVVLDTKASASTAGN